MSDTPRNDGLAELMNGMEDSDKLVLVDVLSRNLERELRANGSMEYCDSCGYPLSQCGELDIEGEPTLDCKLCLIRERQPPTRPAPPALDRLKEEIEGAPCGEKCATVWVGPNFKPPCDCWKSRALRIIEELKHE